MRVENIRTHFFVCRILEFSELPKTVLDRRKIGIIRI